MLPTQYEISLNRKLQLPGSKWYGIINGKWSTWYVFWEKTLGVSKKRAHNTLKWQQQINPFERWFPGDSMNLTFSSPNVGGHLTISKGHLTIPKRSPAELAGEKKNPSRSLGLPNSAELQRRSTVSTENLDGKPQTFPRLVPRVGKKRDAKMPWLGIVCGAGIQDFITWKLMASHPLR